MKNLTGTVKNTYSLALVDNAVTLDVIEPGFVISIDFSALVANEFFFLLVVSFFESSLFVFGQMSFQIFLVIERPGTFCAFVHTIFFLFLKSNRDYII